MFWVLFINFEGLSCLFHKCASFVFANVSAFTQCLFTRLYRIVSSFLWPLIYRCAIRIAGTSSSYFFNSVNDANLSGSSFGTRVFITFANFGRRIWSSELLGGFRSRLVDDVQVALQDNTDRYCVQLITRAVDILFDVIRDLAYYCSSFLIFYLIHRVAKFLSLLLVRYPWQARHASRLACLLLRFVKFLLSLQFYFNLASPDLAKFGIYLYMPY